MTRSTIAITSLLLVGSVFISPGAGAQSKHYTDSLEHLVAVANDDSGKVLLLNELAYTYAESDLSKAKETGLVSVALAEKIHFIKGRSSAQCALGNIVGDQNDMPGALKYYKAALEGKKQIGDARGVATISANIGIIYKKMGRFQEAVGYARASLAQRAALGDLRGEADSYNNIGTLYSTMGATDSAVFYSMKALGIRSELKDSKGIATSYFNVGAAQMAGGRYREALTNEMNAATIFEKLDDQRSLIGVYTGIAKLNKKLTNTDGAIRYATEAIAISKKTGIVAGLADLYETLGEVYQERHNNKASKQYLLLALASSLSDDKIQRISILGGLAVCAQRDGRQQQSYDYYQKSLAIARSSQSKQDLAMMLNSFAETKLGFGDTIGVMSILREAEALSKKEKYRPRLLDCYQNYADYFRFQGDTALARVYLDRSHGVADSLFTDKVAASFAHEQTKYETGKKDREIVSLKDQQMISRLLLEKQKLQLRERQYQILAVVSFMALLGIVAIVFYKRQKRRIREKLALSLIAAESRERLLSIYPRQQRQP